MSSAGSTEAWQQTLQSYGEDLAGANMSQHDSSVMRYHEPCHPHRIIHHLKQKDNHGLPDHCKTLPCRTVSTMATPRLLGAGKELGLEDKTIWQDPLTLETLVTVRVLPQRYRNY